MSNETLFIAVRFVKTVMMWLCLAYQQAPLTLRLPLTFPATKLTKRFPQKAAHVISNYINLALLFQNNWQPVFDQRLSDYSTGSSYLLMPRLHSQTVQIMSRLPHLRHRCIQRVHRPPLHIYIVAAALIRKQITTQLRYLHSSKSYFTQWAIHCIVANGICRGQVRQQYSRPRSQLSNSLIRLARWCQAKNVFSPSFTLVPL